MFEFFGIISVIITIFIIIFIIYQLERIAVNAKRQTKILKEIALKQGVSPPILNNILNN
jgi:cell division protein FtsW (lipid II flippase)